MAVPAAEPVPSKPSPNLQTYVVEDGDNPFDISNKFSITDETLLSANGLGPDSVLQIGQRLLIPPVSGVVVSTQPGDTPKAIADQWKIDLARLISVNNLAAGVNALLPGEPLVIPGAMPSVQIWPLQGDDDSTASTDPQALVKTAQPATQAAAPARQSQAKAPAPILPPVATRPAVRRSGPNNFPWGQCTWWAANERPDIGSAVIGNAASWLYSARAAGLATGTVPRVGAVVVYQPGAQGAAWTGHVAYVTSVSPDRVHFTISEMNFPIWGGVTNRTSSTGWGVGFIY
jgi:surface antigen